MVEEEPAEGDAGGVVPLVRHSRKGREIANNPADFERKHILYLQRLDPDFKDIVEICEWSPSPEGPQEEEALDEARLQFKETLKKNGVSHSEANKRADAAKKEMKMYELDEVLYRMVQQNGSGGYERRVVVPQGDVKSFTWAASSNCHIVDDSYFTTTMEKWKELTLVSKKQWPRLRRLSGGRP